jgi:ubiquinone/menaquinone biosynthesis C-methylase UbiE
MTPPSRSELVRGAYQDEAVARSYEEDRSRHPSQRARAALERSLLRRALARVPRDARILDVACGTGRLAGLVSGFGASLTGVDVSCAMLGAAKAHALPGVSWVAGDATRLPFATGSFDVVLSTRFVRHLESPGRVAVFRELARVSRRFVVVELLLGTGLVSFVKRLTHSRAWREEIAPRRPTHETVVRELEASGLLVLARHALIPAVSQPHLYVCSPR